MWFCLFFLILSTLKVSDPTLQYYCSSRLGGWFICLGFFPCSAVVVYHSEPVTLQVIVHIDKWRDSGEHSAEGWCLHTWNSPNSSNPIHWHGLGIAIRNTSWILRSQTRDRSRQREKGQTQWAIHLTSVPTHRWIQKLIKGCSAVVIKL